MSEEWGPWIEHDGKGCPCVGAFVHIVYADGFERKGRATGGGSWRSSSGLILILRYRIRKPRALIELIEMVENLPQPERVEA